MSGICGWMAGAMEPAASEALIGRMAQQLARFDATQPQVASGPCGAIAVSGGSHVHVFRSGSVHAAIWGHARFQPSDSAPPTAHDTITQAFAEAYLREGAAAVSRLSGAFAAAVLDEARGRALIAVDRSAICPLAYAWRGGALAFGSSLDALALHPQARPALDPQGLYNYVYFHMVPAPGTIYRDVRRLLPGEYLELSDGRIETRRYWEMRFEEDTRRPFGELQREFLATMRDAVRRAAGGGEVGAFLSGGTDSSTVAGLLGEVTGEPARTYSIGFEAEGYDEMAYARIAARHFGTRHHEYYVTPEDVTAAIPRIAALHDQPFGNSSAVPAYHCSRLAHADGVRTLLAGDGGDELFGGNARYATQRIYSLYSDLPLPLRKGLIEPIANALPGALPAAGKLRRYIEHASMPMPERYDNYNLLERFGAGAVFTDEFLAGIDVRQPRSLMKQVYGEAHARTLINRMLALDLKFTLADNDLPKVMRAGELAGVAVRFPMLDDAVVAFSARLQPRLKLKGTRLRYFFKQALRGFLPDEIIAKRKHGFGLPFGPWLQQHEPLRQIALDSLSSLKRRRIVRPEFLDELTSLHVRSHAGYYGTMVWVLMMLEQWFATHN